MVDSLLTCIWFVRDVVDLCLVCSRCSVTKWYGRSKGFAFDFFIDR